MTPERRERANRITAVWGVGMSLNAAMFGWYAWELVSWRAVGFALAASFCGLSVCLALFFWWVATSVNAGATPVGEGVTESARDSSSVAAARGRKVGR